MPQVGWPSVVRRAWAARLAVGPSQLGPPPARLISTSTKVPASASTHIPPGARLGKLKGLAGSAVQAATSKVKKPATAPKATPEPAKARCTVQAAPKSPNDGAAEFVALDSEDWCTLPSYVNKLRPTPSPEATVDRHRQLAVSWPEAEPPLTGKTLTRS